MGKTGRTTLYGLKKRMKLWKKESKTELPVAAQARLDELRNSGKELHEDSLRLIDDSFLVTNEINIARYLNSESQ